MSFVLGLSGMLYASLLPGYVVVRLLNLHSAGVGAGVVLAFALSLVINFFTVTVLVALGIYTSVTVHLLFALSVAAIAFLHRRALAQPPGDALRLASRRVFSAMGEFAAAGRSLPQPWKLLRLVLGLAALYVLAYYFVALYRNFGTIFHVWDDVVSWNHWATMWAGNRFPHGTHQYPQLLPVAFSLTYVFLDDPRLQFFAKGMVPLFHLATVAGMVGLALRTRRVDYAIAAIVVALLFRKIIAWLQFEGFADIPVACLAFLSIYALLLARDEPLDVLRRRLVWVGAVVAAGAALTKQVGLLVAAMYPLLAYLVVLARDPSRTLRQNRMLALRIGCVIALVAVPWYLVSLAQVWMGSNPTNLYDLVVVEHQGRGAVERAVRAAGILAGLLPAGVLVTIAAGATAAIADRCWRWIVLLVIVPFCLIWALLFSYDQRNLAMALPLIACAFGVGAGTIARSCGAALWRRMRVSGLRVWQGARGLPLWSLPLWIWACAAGSAAAVALGLRFDDARMLDRQHRLQRDVGEDEANAALYRALEAEPGRIITNYTMLTAKFLPGLEHAAIATEFSDSRSLERLIRDSGARYVLARTDVLTASDVPEFIERKIREGDYEFLFRKTRGRNFIFVRVLRR